MNKISKILLLTGLLLILSSLNITLYYIYEEKNSSKNIDNTINNIISSNEISINENGFNTITINNIEYIGYLEIPVLNLYLPITNGYTYETLKKTPALYYGNIMDKFIICGHNYKYHFGKLNQLNQKDKIIFIDVNNNKYEYEVELIEVLKGNEVEEMIETTFDLTLYTCTKDSKNRITIRCNRI